MVEFCTGTNRTSSVLAQLHSFYCMHMLAGCVCLLSLFLSHSKLQIGFMSPRALRSLSATLQKKMKRTRLSGDFNESYFNSHGAVKSHIMKQRLVCLFFNELYLYLTLTILIHFL